MGGAYHAAIGGMARAYYSAAAPYLYGMRKLLWTALATTMTAVASAMAYRAAQSLWRSVAGSEPPHSRLASWVMGAPLRKRVLATLEA